MVAKWAKKRISQSVESKNAFFTASYPGTFLGVDSKNANKINVGPYYFARFQK